MKRTVLAVGMTRLCEPTHGEWCSACALPSGIVVTYAMTINGHPSSIETFGWCADCERTWRP